MSSYICSKITSVRLELVGKYIVKQLYNRICAHHCFNNLCVSVYTYACMYVYAHIHIHLERY